MKRKVGLLFCFCLTLTVAYQAAYAGGGKEPVPREVNLRGAPLQFSEMYVYHDTVRGTTQVVFYKVPKAYKKLVRSKKTSLYESYYYSDRFALVSEKMTREKQANGKKAPVYTAVLQARNGMLHRENIEALLSQILRRQVTAEDIEVRPPQTYVMGIMFNYDDYMYFPSGNSIGVFYNEYSRRILYRYDIAKGPIEFCLGYR